MWRVVYEAYWHCVTQQSHGEIKEKALVNE